MPGCNQGYEGSHTYRASAGVLRRGALCQCGLAYMYTTVTDVKSSWVVAGGRPVLGFDDQEDWCP